MAWRRVPLPSDTGGWAERPTVRGATIAVGLSRSHPLPGPVPVAAILDIDGSPGFTLEHAARGRDVEASEPAIGADGAIRVAAYEHDLELVILGAHRDGTRLPSTSLGSDYPLHAADMGSKLATAIAACDDGGFLVSWSYRQVRAYFVGKYRDGDDDAVWSADEWMVASTGGYVVGNTVPESSSDVGTSLVCRDVRDGRIAWEREGTFATIAGAAGGAFLLVDFTARHAEHARRSADAEAAFVDSRVTETELERAWDTLPAAPTHVALLDAATGTPWWQLDVPGHVLAAQLGDGIVDVVTSDERGEARLVSSATTETLVLPGRVVERWPPTDPRGPFLVGRHGAHVVWMDATTLHAGDFAIALPGDLAGFHRMGRDRVLTKPSAVVAAGHVYARRGADLWILELP